MILDLQEKIAELQEMPRTLRSYLDSTTDPFWKRPPASGGFSLTEQICHLRDLEQEGYLLRIRRMLQESCPDLDEFDGAKVAATRNYLSQDPRQALANFENFRHSSTSLLSSLTGEQLARIGRFGVFGMITLAQLVDMMLEHDRSHRKELEDLRKEWLVRK